MAYSLTNLATQLSAELGGNGDLQLFNLATSVMLVQLYCLVY